MGRALRVPWIASSVSQIGENVLPKLARFATDAASPPAGCSTTGRDGVKS